MLKKFLKISVDKLSFLCYNKYTNKERGKKNMKTTNTRPRPKTYNMRTTDTERNQIKEVITSIKEKNNFKSETDALLFLVDFYVQEKNKEERK